ncbi:HDOD domain-containing protein [Tepidicella baoligensis]|uniref:HDOD domain-containing protein n=1 Tax=Tepidicella baoligensis TaxID=2707016 RepID=UPI0015DAD9BA|nr:HDOD domain-containing protein [Tepidicella baoligensis]
MALNLLEHVAFAYQPIWGRTRQLIGVRLRVRVVNPESVSAAQLLHLLSEELSADSPFVLVSFAEAGFLREALSVNPHEHIWLELPDFGDDVPPGLLETVAYAHRMGHRLVQDAPLARAKPLPSIGQGVHRYLLHLWPEQASQALHAARHMREGAAAHSPVLAEQLYRGIGQRELAMHCLDDCGAWGLCGWPVDDVLIPYQRYGVPVDKLTLVRVQQALMRQSSMEVVEDLIHQDAVLTFRTLRLVNSPVFGTSREVTTVRQALMLLGQRRLRDWLLELMPGASGDRELLPVRLGLVLRARLMEHLMEAGLQRDLRTEIYVTGLFSMLGQLMNEPLSSALRRIPVSEAMGDALLREAGPYHTYLDIARRMERFDELQHLPGLCDAAAFPIDHVNRSLIRTIAGWRNTL